MSLEMQPRRRPARDQRGRDHDVLLLDVLGDQRGLLGLIVLRHFLGVAAGGLGLLEFLVLDRDELGAEAFDLLLGRRTHVGRGDDGAEPARGRDRLQAGDAGAHDEHLRRRHRAGRRHHHRQRAAIFGGAVDHRAVAGEIGLAREHIHDLRAGDARHQLHREGGDAGIGHGLERRVLAVGVHDGDDERALLVAGKLGGGGPAHLEHHVGVRERVGGHGRAGGGEFGVGNAGPRSGARLDRDLGAEPLHLLDRVRRRGDPIFGRVGLTRDSNAHSPVSW